MRQKRGEIRQVVERLKHCWIEHKNAKEKSVSTEIFVPDKCHICGRVSVALDFKLSIV